MKKTVLALAVLAAVAGPAFAQSSVTVYGIVDLSVSKLNNGQSNLTFFNDWQIGKRDVWTMRSASSSRLGFRGSEDLGGGLKANFLIEHRFQPDTGAVEPRDGVTGTTFNPGFWNAQTFVGLSSTSLGEVRFGRQYVPAFYVGLGTDPFGYEFSVGGAANFTRGGNGVSTANNAVSYFTPNLGGFSANLMVAAGEGGVAAVGAAGTGRNVGANVQYTAGPLWLGVGYNDARHDSTPLQNRATVFGASYDFGVAKLMGNYSLGKNNIAGNPSTKTMLVGATVPAGNGVVRMVAARYDAAVGQNPNVSGFSPYNSFGYTNGANTNKLGLGYVYNLSKRTSVNAEVGTAKTEGFSRSTGVQTGLKHTF